MYDRTRCAPRGFLGGQEGRLGEIFLSDGTVMPPKGRYDLQPDQSVTLRIPGGGGYGPAFERDPRWVFEDVLQEHVSVEAAREFYGVVIAADPLRLDMEATALLRQKANG